MTEYRIEAATKEEWAERALRAEAKLAMVEALMDAGFAEYERRLAKAVEGLEGLMMHEPDYSDTLWQNARTTLAELKGQGDE